MSVSALLAALLVASMRSSTVPAPRPGNAHFYQRHREILADPARTHAEILLLGDSITERLGNNNASMPPMPGQLAWDTYFRGRACNLGVHGDRTEHLLWRIAHGELDGANPQRIVLLIGTNNLYVDSADDVLAGIETVCEAAQRKCRLASITLLGILPRADVALDKTEHINNALGLWCMHTRRVHFVDMANQFTVATFSPETFAQSPIGRHRAPISTYKYAPDGIHLSAAGYQAMAARMFATAQR